MSEIPINKIICGDALEVLKTMPDEVIDCCITSPPYCGLRDYNVERQLGLEKTPEEYVAKIVKVFREIKRVLKKEGNFWLNLGDSYAGSMKGSNGSGGFSVQSELQKGNNGSFVQPVNWKNVNLKPKDLCGIPWRVALALQADGWILRQDIIWAKPNPMPESVTDRCTKAHEYIFLMAKSAKYYFNNEAIKERTLTHDNSNRNRDITKLNNTPGRTKMKGLKTNAYELRNRRSVWTITTKPFKGAHFATFPEDLIRPMILAGCPKNGLVLDPFMGAGTTAVVAKKLGRNYLGIDLNPQYVEMANKRIQNTMKCLI